MRRSTLQRVLSLILSLAATSQARSDIILTYHLSSFVPAIPGDMPPATPIPTNDPLGPALTGPGVANPNSPSNPLVFTVGETKYLQIAIQANAMAPTIVNGQIGRMVSATR